MQEHDNNSKNSKNSNIRRMPGSEVRRDARQTSRPNGQPRRPAPSGQAGANGQPRRQAPSGQARPNG
ncbi:MAG: hypothetical protein K1W30_02550, partial [Lachnospiraceae bacterium]